MKRKSIHHTYLHVETGLKIKVKRSDTFAEITTAAGDIVDGLLDTEYFTASGQRCLVTTDEGWPAEIEVSTKIGTVRLEKI